MPSFPRLLAFSVLLLAFLGAGLGAQAWLRRQTERIRAETVQDKRAQWEAALAVLPKPPAPEDDSRRRNLERLLGAKVVIDREPNRAPADTQGLQTLEFAYPLEPGAPAGATAHVTFPMPAATRLMLLNERMALVLVLVVPATLALIAGAFLFGTARGAGTRAPWTVSARAEMGSLEHLARTSVAQGEALTRERDVRRRAEEDAQLNQQRLNQSVEEKIRIGRDLHDGIIQSLYAVGLTLESARSLAAADPAEADRRMSKCLEGLNATIRDVRNYITGLSPETLRQAGFGQALDALIGELRAERKVEFDLRIDNEATAFLSEEQGANTLQIVREAISNGLRHGGATRITVRLHQTDREVCLLVQDNGRGFDTAGRTGGNGLGNMRARAQSLGAALKVESQPGSGTRVVATLPLHLP